MSDNREPMTPVVIDLGKARRRRVKALKRGRGPLTDEVAEVVEQVHRSLGPGTEGVTLVPVVIIYEKKRKRKKGGRGGLFGF